nr:MAG TPA: minor tail protein [Caudoviricetes sp.]
MVEELKLAIKIDDATIEQSLLKQFANAQKMADKVVLDFKNVNFDDKQIEAKFKEMQKKAGQNPIDFSISGNTLDMLGQIDKRLIEIFSIGKGKSFIDSSSTVADIGKIENKINELDKKYEEAQKKLSSIGSGGISGKDVNLVDNKEFQKLSDNFEKIKGEIDELKQKINTIDIDTEWLNNFTTGLDEELTDTQAKLDNFINDFNSSFEKINTSTSNTLFNEESIRIFEKLLTSIESSLSSIKGILVDVGDGEELSPLLREINNIQTAIGGLSSSFSNLHFNMNIDMGTDNQMDAKIQEKAAKALNAYEKLFNGLKMSGYGGEVVNNKFFDFDINKFDTTIGKVKAYKDIIERLRKEAKEYYGGTDLLRTQTDDKLWRSASSAGGQLTQAINETAKSKTDNPLTELFGKTDLSGVIEQLNTIISKLDEISVSAKGFTETFKNGLNVNASVEEIEKLTNRVKELEAELAKIKTPATTIPSDDMKDAFPKTSENLEQVAQSEQKVQQEAVATDKALDNISFTPNTEGFEDIIAKFGILREQAEQITKIVKTTKQTADGTPNISYKATLRNGSSYYLGENSTPQVLNASETVYDVKADNAKKLEREKQIWNELTTSLERYATIQKRIASNNALSTDNAEAIKLLEHIRELQRNDILPTEKLTASNEKLQQINQTVTDLKVKLKESTLDSLQGSIDKYQKIYDQRKTYSSDFTPSEQYTKNLTELNTAIGNLVEYRNTLKNVSEVTVEQETELKGLVTACEKASDSFKSLSASEKGASQIAIDKLVQRINKDLDECTNYSKEAKLGLRALRDELESANPRNLKEITSEIINIENAEIRAGRAGRSFFDTLKNSGFHQLAAQMAGMFGFYDVINVIRQAASTVTELNTQITELAKVSEQSSSQIYADFDSYADIAKEVRGTISDTIAATADWSKNGYSIPDSKQLAEISQLYKNVGDGIDIDAANESLISTLKGFQLEADQAEHIVDVFNEVSNNEAISSGGIGEALQRSAASFNAASTSLEKSVSLVTATNSVLQDPEKVGKQILAYLYSNVMKIKVAISVKPLRRARPRKDYNV